MKAAYRKQIEKKNIDYFNHEDNLNTLMNTKISLSNALHNKMLNLSNQSIDEQDFTKNAVSIFTIYLKDNDIEKDQYSKTEGNKFLAQQFKKLYQSYDKQKPKTFVGHFVGFLNSFAEWIGIKDNKAKVIIQNTVNFIKQDVQIKTSLNNLNTEIKNKNKEIKSYNLLDCLINQDKLQKLDDKELSILYNLAVLEPSINELGSSEDPQYKKYTIDSLHNKIKKANGANESINRTEMLSDISYILSKSDSTLTQSKINLIKCMKTDVALASLEGYMSNIKMDYMDDIKKENQKLFDNAELGLSQVKKELDQYLHNAKKYDYETNKHLIPAAIKITFDQHPQSANNIIMAIEEFAIERFTSAQKKIIGSSLKKILESDSISSTKLKTIVSLAKTALVTPDKLEKKVLNINYALSVDDKMNKQLQEIAKSIKLHFRDNNGQGASSPSSVIKQTPKIRR
jgi:hypothetical protein